MCKSCDKTVREMDVRDTDLPQLPYTVMKWCCIVPDCKNHTKVHDYGISPLYYWPIKIRRLEDGSWRGGWFGATNHFYVCSKHWPLFKKGDLKYKDIEHNEEICFSKIKPITKHKKVRL